MFNLLEFTREYLLPRTDTSTPAPRDEADHGLVVTGEGLVDGILDAIRLRRSVLVSGPRGCGKTYCVKQAIKRAYDAGDIGGWHFLQGNREIPRDYISEDMLVINRNAQPELLDALAIRPPSSDVARTRAKKMREGPIPAESGGDERVSRFPSWPAIPALTLHELRRKRQDPHWTPWTLKTDWVVLFLDEINRFGDGFLDSLLSLTEEGIIVRGGDEYHVPVVVVATANPPGYDVTAKKLSPPLQARIGRSYRVSQPPLDHLVQVVLPSKQELFGSALGRSVTLDDRVKYLAAAATLCLWGNPDAGVRGASFLTSGTRALLREAMRKNVVIKRAMTDLSILIQFGPDARAIGEWIGAAAAVAQNGAIHEEHLISTAGPVLGHKLRESFNEGSEPEKVAMLQQCIHDIVSTVLKHPVYTELFFPRYDKAAARLGMTQRALFTRLSRLPAETRWHGWIRALADLPDEASLAPGSFREWRLRQGSSKRGKGWQAAFTAQGQFLTYEERSWFENVLLANVAPEDEAGDAKTRLALRDHLSDTLTDVETSVRHALQQKPYVSRFAQGLLDVARRNEAFLRADKEGTAQRAWVTALDSLIDPHGGELAPLVRSARDELSRATKDDLRSVDMLRRSLQAVSRDAMDKDWRDRADEAIRLLRAPEQR